jgi:hypothetical protein
VNRLPASRSALLALVVFVAVFAAYRGLRSPGTVGMPLLRPLGADPVSVTPETRMPGPADATRSTPEAPAGRPGYTLTQALQAMPAASRDALLRRSIEDAGFGCSELSSAHEGLDATWRVACTGAHAYLVTADAIGRLVVQPLFYFDGSPSLPAEPTRVEPPIPDR